MEWQVTNNVKTRKKWGGYHAIHKWLVKYYGKANKCVNPQCKNKSKTYHWAKLKNKKHGHKRDNYIMLCVSCHRIYDISIEEKKRLREINIGRKINKWARKHDKCVTCRTSTIKHHSCGNCHNCYNKRKS